MNNRPQWPAVGAGRVSPARVGRRRRHVPVSSGRTFGRRTVLVVAAACIALFSAGSQVVNAGRGSGGGGPAPTPTPTPTTFTRVFSTQDNGAIRMFGNSNMTCDAGATNCATAQDGTPGLSLWSYNNNAYTMRWIDNDADTTTFNSTSADLAIPDGSTILRAQLVWGGNAGSATVGDRSAVRLAVGNGTYQTVSAEAYAGQQASPIWTSSGFYQASADITSIVAANPGGTYWVADVASIPDVSNKFAGWALIVAYRNPGEPVRDLTINLGLDQISGTDNTQIVVDGFLTPLSGTVNASVGLVAWEGDLGIIGDTAALDGTQLSNANHPSTNFFDSSVSDPTVNAARNPDYVNGMGVDVARVDASNIIANGATSATLLLSTTGDAYAPGVVTTQVDLFAPAFAAVTKSVVNLNGHDPAWPGDTLEYQISLANTGGDSAEVMQLTDTIPTGTTYVADSIAYLPSTATPTETAMTDATGDDAADFDATTGVVTARIGTGANPTMGGTLAPLESAAIRFRVTVDEGPTVGSPVTNSARLDYLSPTIDKIFTYRTNTVTTATAAVADVKVVKTALGNPTTDNPVRYQLTVTNNGPSDATGVVLNDTMPTPTFSPTGSPISGMSVVDDPPVVVGATGTCTRTPFVNGATTYYPSFDCAIDTLAVGESATVTFEATVYGTAIADITNTATVTADQVDTVAANNTDTRTSLRSEVTDLWLRGGPNPGRWNGLVTAGQAFPYLMEIVTLDYQGYATAQNVVVSIELPLGFSYVTDSSTGPNCTQTGQLLECPYGANPPGAAPGPSWTVQLLPDPSLAGGNYPYAVEATTSTPEVSLANNSNTGNFNLADTGAFPSYQTDLAVTETLDGAIVAGGVAAYTITLTNNGPSTSYRAKLSQPTPLGYTIDSISSDQGVCADVAGDLACTFDPLVPANDVTIRVVYRVDADLGADNGTTAISLTATATQGTDNAQFDTDPTNDSATATGSITRRADLALTKTQDTYGFTWGDTIAFTFTATNLGPSTARGVTLTDTLPVDMTAVTPMPLGCSVIVPATATSGDVFECVLPDTGVGASRSVTVPVATSSAGAGSATNTAAVSAATTDPEPANNTPATTISTADQAADLSITKSVSDSTPIPGAPFTYTVTVTNNGPSDAHADWSVTDTLPTGVDFVSGVGCSAGTPGEVTCATGAALVAGTSQTFTFTVGAVPGRTGRIVNTATVDPGVTDPNYDDNSRNNNTASVGADLAPLADLVLTAPSAPPSFPAGGAVAVGYNVTNLGPSTATTPIVVFSVPAGVAITADTTYPAGYGCSQSGQQVRCSLPSTAPGAPKTLPLIVSVGSARPPGSIAIDGRVGTETPESDLTNNAAALALTVTNDAALTITKSGPEAAFTAGATATYTVTVTNTGSSDTPTGQYVVTDTVPAGLTVLSAAMPGATCSVVDSTVTCTRTRIPGGTDVTLTIGVLVGTDIDPAGVTNTAQLTNNTDIGPSPLNSNAVTTPVTASSALWVTKTADRDTVAAGGSIVYSMVIGNDGPSSAPAVVVTDDLPNGLTVQGSGVTTDTGSCSGGDGATSVVCNLGDIPAGGRANITIQARVPNSLAAGATVTNTAAVTDGRGDTPASGSVSSAAVQEADLAVVKYPLSDIPVAGLEHQYVISAVNNGPSTAAGVVVTDQLPAGATLTDVGPADANCSESSGLVTCALGDLARAEVVAVLVTVTLDASLGGTELTNAASISSDTADPNSTDNTATVTQTVEALSTFSMTKTISDGLVDGAVVAGSNVTYTITATNVGPSDASNAWILDRIPTDANGNPLATFVSASIDGDVATCAYVEVVDDGPTPTITDRYHQCTHGTLPVGETMTMNFTISVNADAKGQITNWAWGGADNNTEASPAPALGLENSPFASATAPILGQADIVVSLNLGRATPGATLYGGVNVGNLGPQTAEGTVVDIVLPRGATFSYSPDGNCVTGGGGVRCTIGSIAPESTAGFGLVLTTDPAVTGTTEASAVGSTTTVDPDLTNNRSVVPVQWNPATGLSISKAAPPTAAPGGTMTYSIALRNEGPSVATGLVISDLLPTVAVPTAATMTNGGACSIDGQQVTCSLDALAVQATVYVSIDVSIDLTATGELTNVASVNAATFGATVYSAPATTVLVPNSALTITKSAPTSAVPGRSIAYEIAVTNSGPSTATEVVVADRLPDGAVPTTASISGGGTCAIEGQQVTCTLDQLDVTAVASVSIDAAIDASATGELFNQATVSAASATSPVPSAFVRTILVPSSPLTISKMAPGTALPGATAVYGVTIYNIGPSTATGVVVSDRLPDGAVPTDVTMTAGGTCSIIGQDVECTLASLATAGSASVRIEAAIDQRATGELANQASASADASELVTTEPAITKLVPQTALSVVKSAPAVAVPGRSTTYEIVVSNDGPSTATDVVVSDRLPAGATPTAASVTADGTCTVADQLVTCEVALLDVEASATVTIEAAISPDSVGELINTAEVSAATITGSIASEPVRVALVPETALSLVKSAPERAVPGEAVTYEISVANAGPSTAFGIVVSDEIPVGASATAATMTNGGTCSISGQAVACELPFLTDNQPATVTIDVMISPDATGELTNSASAFADNGEPVDSNSVSTLLDPSAELMLDLAASHQALKAGEQITYTISVGNHGPSAADDVTAMNELPHGLSTDADSVSTSKGTCSVADQMVTCLLGRLMPDEVHTIAITAVAEADMPDGAMMSNQVSLSSSSSNPLVDKVDVEMVADATTTSTASTTTVPTVNTTPSTPPAGGTAVPTVPTVDGGQDNSGGGVPGGKLPATGYNLALLISFGAGLIVLGVWLRREGRRSA